MALAALVVPIALVSSILRTVEQGWRGLFTLHVAMVVVMVLMAVFRQRMRFHLRAGILVGFVFMVGLVGLIIGVGVVQEKLAKSLLEVREQQAVHERLTDNLVDAFLYRKDPDGVLNDVSSSVTSVLGSTPELPSISGGSISSCEHGRTSNGLLLFGFLVAVPNDEKPRQGTALYHRKFVSSGTSG